MSGKLPARSTKSGFISVTPCKACRPDADSCTTSPVEESSRLFACRRTLLWSTLRTDSFAMTLHDLLLIRTLGFGIREPVVQRTQTDAKQASGLFAVVVSQLERRGDVLPFNLLQRAAQIELAVGGGVALARKWLGGRDPAPRPG